MFRCLRERKRMKKQEISRVDSGKLKERGKGKEERIEVSMEERFRASMVLAGVGDALGYGDGNWEFNYSGLDIHTQFEALGGLKGISIAEYRVSDDQVMHIATGFALMENPEKLEDLYELLAQKYIESFDDMAGRAPGRATAVAIDKLRNGTKYNEIPHSLKDGGCGAAMRAMCIGLRFFNDEDKLIAVSIESGRITHNNPTGFFGALGAALFTAYAINGIPVTTWGRKMVNEVLPRAYEYLETQRRDWQNYQVDLNYFKNRWIEYLQLRKIYQGDGNPQFPEKYGVQERDQFYQSISYSGWGGSSGHDSVIIAYDALLGAGSDFNELVLRGVLHGGDNDSTGVIACAWWGAIYGFFNVPKNIFENVEKRKDAEKIAARLYQITHERKAE